MFPVTKQLHSQKGYPLPEQYVEFTVAPVKNGWYLFGGMGRWNGTWGPMEHVFFYDFELGQFQIVPPDQKPYPKIDVQNTYGNEWMHDAHIGTTWPEGSRGRQSGIPGLQKFSVFAYLVLSFKVF